MFCCQGALFMSTRELFIKRSRRVLILLLFPRCMTQTLDKVDSELGGLMIALCCHHRCEWSPYVGKEFLTEQGTCLHLPGGGDAPYQCCVDLDSICRCHMDSYPVWYPFYLVGISLLLVQASSCSTIRGRICKEF
jgi:hypothetical protein